MPMRSAMLQEYTMTRKLTLTIRSLETNELINVTTCDKNYVPQVYLANAKRRTVMIDGMVAEVLSNPDRAKYIVLTMQDHDGRAYNLYTYDKAIMHSEQFVEAEAKPNAYLEKHADAARCNLCNQRIIRKRNHVKVGSALVAGGVDAHSRCADNPTLMNAWAVANGGNAIA